MCGGCVRAISNKLSQVENISFDIDLEGRTVKVDFQDKVDDNKVLRAIKSAGYDAARL